MTGFEEILPEERLSYVIDNLRTLTDDQVEEGIDILVQANETEYAVVLARDHDFIDRAIQILIDAGDYLWAALIAKNDGREEESKRLYWMGLDYYIGMEMYGRAVSAATALNLPPDQIDALYVEGVASERKKMDTTSARIVLETVASTLEDALAAREDELSKEVLNALYQEKDKEKKRREEEE